MIFDLQIKIDGANLMVTIDLWPAQQSNLVMYSVQLRSTPNVPVAAKVDLKGSIPLYSLETKCSYFLCLTSSP